MTNERVEMMVNIDGMFDAMVRGYYNPLTKKEKQGIDYEYYEQNKHLSLDFIDYYQECIKKRKEKKNAYMRAWRLKRKEEGIAHNSNTHGYFTPA